MTEGGQVCREGQEGLKSAAVWDTHTLIHTCACTHEQACTHAHTCINAYYQRGPTESSSMEVGRLPDPRTLTSPQFQCFVPREQVHCLNPVLCPQISAESLCRLHCALGAKCRLRLRGAPGKWERPKEMLDMTVQHHMTWVSTQETGPGTWPGAEAAVERGWKGDTLHASALQPPPHPRVSVTHDTS